MWNSKERQDWLDSLKAGDKIAIVSGSRGFLRYEIAEVEKITPARGIIRTSKKVSFKKDGWEDNSSKWGGRYHIEPVTAEIKEWIRRDSIARALSRADFATMNLEKLEKVYAIIKEG